MKVAEMPAQNTKLNRRQGFPSLDSIRIVLMEELPYELLDLFGERAVWHPIRFDG